MIRYSLVCAQDHGFEAWFGQSADFDEQASRGLVECPICASSAVRKAIMAPAVTRTRKRGGAETPPPDPQAMRTVFLEQLRRVREHVEEHFDYVGDAFAREARDIHAGKSEDRGIYGEATPEEVRALKEDGVAVAPLPVVQDIPKQKLN